MRSLSGSLILSTTLAMALAAAQAPARPAGQPAARPARTARAGPAVRIKGLHRSLPTTDQEWVQAALRDFRGGMMVVVEDRAPLPWEQAPSGRNHLFGPWNPRPFDLPLAPGMDPSKVIAGGNTIGQIYPLGWGN